MHVGNYLVMVRDSEKELADAFRKVAAHHVIEPDISHLCQKLASWSNHHQEALQPFVDHYHDRRSKEPENLHSALFHGTRTGGLGLLRDLHDLFLLSSEVKLLYTLLTQAARALHDKELEKVCEQFCEETDRQVKWVQHRSKQAAAQTLVLAP